MRIDYILTAGYIITFPFHTRANSTQIVHADDANTLEMFESIAAILRHLLSTVELYNAILRMPLSGVQRAHTKKPIDIVLSFLYAFDTFANYNTI